MLPAEAARVRAVKPVEEKAAKVLELRVLRHAFPESHLKEVPFLWDRNYLADRQVTLRIDRTGNLAFPGASHQRSRLQPAPG